MAAFEVSTEGTMVRRTQSRGLGGSRVYKWPSGAGKTEIPANR